MPTLESRSIRHRSPRGRHLAVALAAAALCGSGGLARAQNVLPSSGHVVAGSATIAAPNGKSLAITETSNRAVINWNAFSVGPTNSVNFWQPSASAAILNRVTGTANSTIAGTISANGQIFLVNPNGIAITKTGTVNVGGGFVASTLGIADGDFMSGNLNFTGNGASARVANAGSIVVGAGGFAALLGGTVANSGTILVPLGKVALGSGEQATLDLNGDGFMQVAVPTGATTADGEALVTNSGKVVAAGGLVQMKAATVATAMRNAVNLSGVVAANSVSGHDGEVELSGGPGGSVTVGGKIDVSAPVTGNVNGGTVIVDGAQVTVEASAAIDASGAIGGTILVGASGKGGVDKAQSTTIEPGAQLLALGNPAAANSGGYIETSGDQLVFGGAIVNAGKGGQWLLDPQDLTVDAAAATTIDATLNGNTSVTEETTATTVAGGSIGNSSSGLGDINIDAALSFSPSAITPTVLTVSAYNSININAPITIGGTNGGLVLTTNNHLSGTNTAGSLNFLMGYGSVQYTGTGGTLGIGNAGAPTAYTLLFDMGNDATGVPSMNNSSGFFALAAPIANAGTFTNSMPVASFSGTFNGLGNTISNLIINDPGDGAVGLFGQLGSGGKISNIGLVGGSVTGAANSASIGTLVGDSSGAISNAYATSSVAGGAGSTIDGGLVGSNESSGTITNAYATGTVSGGTNNVGGLVGQNILGTITNSYATGMVSGGIGASIGGLVGYNFLGTITDVYATGPVSGGSGASVGGLAGINFSGAITDAYATGAVTGTGATRGGLIGNNSGTITNGYWDTDIASPGIGSDSGSETGGGGVNTAGLGGLESSTVLAALNSPSTVWGNVNNQTTPYLLGLTSNPQTVFVSGAGTQPYQLLFTMGQVQNINNGLNGFYALANSLDASTDPTTPATWTPIGTDGLGTILNSGNGFNGTFNGLGNTIANLTISMPTGSDVGLFGVVGTSGTVQNLILSGGSVTGQMSTGAVVGNNSGTITNIQSSVAVTGNDEVGGLVGWMTGGTVTNSSSSGPITGNGSLPESIGGLVGELDDGSITGSSATGAVTALDGTYVGGLVGFTGTGTTVTTSFATGAVTALQSTNGGSNVGGLIGSNSGTVSNSYATGAVAGEDNVGGLVGLNELGAVSLSYATGAVSGVAGSSDIGGLIGQDQGGIATTNVYATGAVIGDGNVGGLIGELSNQLSHAYSTGSVQLVFGGGVGMPGPNIGGLVGADDGKGFDIFDAYWDLQSSGIGSSNGAGNNPNDPGIVGLTTAQLQGTATLPGFLLPSILSPAGTGGEFTGGAAGGPTGLYPYLQWRYPTTPQTISGIAYSDTGVTPLASNPNGANFVALDIASTNLGAASTGANGYYYFVEPSGTISSGGSNVLVYTQSNSNGATNAATLTVAKGSISLPVWGNTLIAPTPQLTYSTAVSNLKTDDGSLIANAEGSDAAAQLVVNSTLSNAPTLRGFIATGSSFMVDQLPATGLYAQTTQTGAGLTVTASQTITGGLSLLSAGALTIDAPISISGQSNVNLAVDQLVDLNFAPGAHIDFGAVNNNSTLSINGAPYTLLYDMGNDPTGVANINNGLNGNYALATTLDASAVTGWIPLGTDGNGNPQNSFSGFAGVFTGLGNTISTLSVNIGTNNYAGLFGYSTGNVQNIGLTNASVGGSGIFVGGLAGYNGGTVSNAYATGTVSSSGGFAIGGLVGVNTQTITNSYATVTVSATGLTESEIGGLAGENFTTGTITNSYATGAVSNSGNGSLAYTGGLVGENLGSITNVYATGSVSGVGLQIGGLVGANNGSTTLISNAYATGAVSVVGSNIGNAGGLVGDNTGTIEVSFATGPVSITGNNNVFFGGLVGFNGGTIANVYAMGAVSALGTGNGAIGGLVGINSGGSIATITSAYATGAVTSSSTALPPLGGLIGYNNPLGSVMSGYYDATTSGQPLGPQSINGAASTGLTTTALQAALPNGFSNSIWGIIPGVSYPYLKAFFPTTPQVISGIAYQDAGVTPLVSSSVGAGVVSAQVNGNSVGSASTGVNGYYYFLIPNGTIQGSGSPVIAYTNQNPTTGAVDAISFQETATGSLANFDIHGGWLWERASTNSATTLSTDLSNAIAGNASVPSLSSANMPNQEIDFGAGGFVVDQPTTVAGILVLNGSGAITQSNALGANQLAIVTSSAVDLSSFNEVGTLAAEVTGSGNGFSFGNFQDLKVGTVDGLGGVTTNGSLSGVTTNGGAIELTAFGNLRLEQPVNANNGLALLGPSPGGVFLSVNDSISQTAAGIIVGSELSADAGNKVTLTAANHIGSNDNSAGIAQTPGLVAGNTGFGDFALVNNNAGIQVDALICGCTGITSSGNIYLATTGAGAIIVNQPLSAVGDIDIAVAPGYGFTNNVASGGFGLAGIDTSIASGAIMILADTISLANGTINSGFAPVILGPASANTNVALGAPSSAGTLGLQQADLATITAADLQIGYRNADGTLSWAGNIDVAGNIALTNQIPELVLMTGNGAITESAGAISGSAGNNLILDVLAGGSVTMNQKNSVAHLTAFVDGAGSGFSFVNDSASLSIDTGNAIFAGVQTSSSGIAVAEPLFSLSVPNPPSEIITNGGNVNVAVTTSGSLTIVSGIDAGTGTVTAAAVGDLTLAANSIVSGNSVTLAAGGNFINDAGATPITLGTGNWLIYSNAPGTDTFGGLDSANTPIWNATLATLPPADVTQPGNHYLFAEQPTLTVTTTDVTKVYGQDVGATVANAFTVTGFKPAVTGAYLADNAASTYSSTPTVTSLGSPGTAGVAGSPYSISATQGSLTPLNGYAFAFVDTGTVAVAPAPITVTAVSGTSVYGSSPVNPGLSATGLQNGETVGVLSGLSNSFGIVATSGVAASPYTLTVAGLTANPNYQVTAVDGSWVVTPAPVTVTALGGTSVYGSSPANPGLSVIGLQNGQTPSVLGSPSNSFGIVATSGVAASPYTLTVAGLSTNPNYQVTSVDGSWIVTPAPVTVTALGGTSVYGSSPANPGLAATGLQNGQSVSVLTGLSNSFGIGPTNGVAASPYTLTVAGLSTNPNYQVTATFDGSWIVTPAPITVTALGGTSVYGSSPANPGLSATGLQNGQSVSALAGLSNSFGIGPTSGVSGNPYSLTVAGLSTNPNYQVTATIDGSWIVTPEPVTVTADNLVKIVNQPNPLLTFAITAGALQNGDMFTGQLATTATTASMIGLYPITQGTLALSQNYDLTFINGLLLVSPVPATASADKYIEFSLGPPGTTSPIFCGPADIAAALVASGSAYIVPPGTGGGACGSS